MREGIPANLLSIGAIDFGILIDGTLVMVENIFRELGVREGQQYDLEEVIKSAAKDVDRPIFYSVAVIIAGYLPIYALTGPSGKLFKPMADTVAIALVGAMILTLTLVPVLCAMWFKKGVHERENKPFEWVQTEIRGVAGLVPGPARGQRMVLAVRDFRGHAAADPVYRRRVHAAPRRGRAVDPRHHALHGFVRYGEQVLAAGAGHPDEVPDGDGRGLGAGAARRRHRSDGVLQRRVLRGAEAL